MASPDPNDQEAIGQTLNNHSPDLIIIDGEYASSDTQLFPAIMGINICGLRDIFTEESVQCPTSVVLLKNVAEANADRADVFFFIDDPSVMVIQELLHAGASWVWNHLDEENGNSEFESVVNSIERERPMYLGHANELPSSEWIM